MTPFRPLPPRPQPFAAPQGRSKVQGLALGYLAFGGLLLMGAFTFAMLGVLVLTGLLGRADGLPLGLCVGEACFMTALAVVCGVAAWALWRHRYAVFIRVAASIMALFFPFGTILGVLTFVWLERQDVRSLFARPGAGR